MLSPRCLQGGAAEVYSVGDTRVAFLPEEFPEELANPLAVALVRDAPAGASLVFLGSILSAEVRQPTLGQA